VSPNAVEPGTRLVDRYRLEERLGDAEGTAYWRAQDELLDRPVGVCLLPATDGQAQRVLGSARRAAVLTDARFLRVLDANETDGVVYVVSEWVGATNLVDLLADGPLPPTAARDLALDIAGALGAAHRAGLAHLCLQPEHVLRTTHGQVKLGGLAIDAAVRGLEAVDAEDASRRDAEGTARVAYAALTARWPGGPGTGLAAAPHDGSALCTPRQVRAGVPHDLDVVVSRALRIPGTPGPALGDLDSFADALRGVHLTSRVPVVGRPVPGADEQSPVTPYDEPDPRRRSRTTVLAWAAAVLVLAVGFALAGSQLVLSLRDGSDPSADASDISPSASPSPGDRATGTPLEVASVTSFDPPPGTGDENGYAADLAVDGDPSTVWTTKEYNDPFGPTGLKEGVGLVLDLGSSQQIGSVTVRTVGATDYEVRTADERGSALDDYTPMDDQQVQNADGRAVIVPREQLRARYVLIWLTSLPPENGRYRGRIAEITVRG
jgi:hypothetical protein